MGKYIPVTVDKRQKYTPILNKIVEDKLLEGKPVQQVCKEIGIDESTFFRWCRKYESFADAVREGQHGKIAKVAGAIYQSALGYKVQLKQVKETSDGTVETTTREEYIKPSVTAQKHLLATQSQQAHKWKDTQEITVTRKLESVLKDIDRLEAVDAEVLDD
jgi:transposase-like protein